MRKIAIVFISFLLVASILFTGCSSFKEGFRDGLEGTEEEAN